VRNPGVPDGSTLIVLCVAVSSSSHGKWRSSTERPRGPDDVCPFHDDPLGDPHSANTTQSLAARYFPAT